MTNRRSASRALCEGERPGSPTSPPKEPPLSCARFAGAITLAVAAGVAPGFATTTALAQGLPLIDRGERAPRVDGALGDWRGIRLRAVGEGDDASMRVALAHDAGGLYVVAAVRDDRIIRNAEPTPDEDCVVLTVAVASGSGRWVGSDFWLFPGLRGAGAARAMVSPPGTSRLSAAAGVRVVEGPLDGGIGYTVEAFVPFALLPGGAASAPRIDRMRAAMRLRDVDQAAHPSIEAEPSTATVDPRHLDRLPLVAADSGITPLLTTFARAHHLVGSTPTFERAADVAFDSAAETVILLGTHVFVAGRGYRGGRAFDYLELPVTGAGDLHGVDLIDLDGDGKAELLVRMRQRNDQGTRDLLGVVSFRDARVALSAAIEERKQTPAGTIEAPARIVRQRGGPPLLEHRVGVARGLSAANYAERPANDAMGVLLPWGEIARRTYRFRGGRLELVDEDRRASPAVATGRTSGRDRDSGRSPAARDARPDAAAQVDAPPITMDALLDEYRRQRGIGAGVRPRFQHEANLARDGRPEILYVFGTDLVVMGPGFMSGRRFFVMELPIADPADLVSVEAADVTGEGRREVFIRVRQRLPFGEQSVERQVLLVHHFTPRGFPRLLALEVGRQLADSRIDNAVAPADDGRSFVVEPGRARGFGPQNWPFADGDATAADGIVPVLLPWRDRSVRYRYDHQHRRLMR